jgi:hypothetical protein
MFSSPVSGAEAGGIRSLCTVAVLWVPHDAGLVQSGVDCEHRRVWEIGLLRTEFSFCATRIAWEIGLTEVPFFMFTASCNCRLVLSDQTIAIALCCMCVQS